MIDPFHGDGNIIEEFNKRNIYFNLYKSGYKVFKNYPIVGVGNKNYRVETCNPDNNKFKYLCITHPHQLYFEFLSEHGLFGSIIVLSMKTIKVLPQIQLKNIQ